MPSSQALSPPASSSPLAARDLSKVLKHPSSFGQGCKTRDEELVKWPSWSWEFEQYLSTLDREFAVDFTRIKDNPKTPIVMGTLSDAEKDRSRIMLGFADDLRPNSRQRALALIQATNGWPVFDLKQGLLSQVVRLEQAMSEYDSVTSAPLSDDQRLSALLRCLSGQLRQRSNIMLEDSWTYQTLRGVVCRYDASSSKWNASIAATYALIEAKVEPLLTILPLWR